MGKEGNGRFGRVPAAWWADPDLGADEIVVLTTLATYADPDGRCFPSQQRIARGLNRSRTWVSRKLAVLVRLGFVKKRRRFGRDGGELSAEYHVPSLVRPRSRDGSGGRTSERTPEKPRDDAARGVKDERPSGSERSCVGVTDGSGTGNTERIGRTAPARDIPPDTWRPSQDDRRWVTARFPWIDPDCYAERFVLACRAGGYAYADHSAAFRRWIHEDANGSDVTRPKGGGHERSGRGRRSGRKGGSGGVGRKRAEMRGDANATVKDAVLARMQVRDDGGTDRGARRGAGMAGGRL